MNLNDLCHEITDDDILFLDSEPFLKKRLICPEYSDSINEVKTFPGEYDNRIFALCWRIDNKNTLHTTMFPYKENFCYHFKYKNTIKTQLHTHEYIELSYIVEGEFKQNILGKDITFSKGDLCLIDKNCVHQDFLSTQSATILFFGIPNDMFAEIMDENISTHKIISFLQTALIKQKNYKQYLHFKPRTRNLEDLDFCMYFLVKEMYSNMVGSKYIQKGLLLRIFRILSSQYDFNLSMEQKNAMSGIVFEEVSQYIKEHSCSISIKQLSNVFHFQEDYFNRLIKNKTGMTYSAFVQDVRLSKAEYLLKTTDKSIDKISKEIGYNNRGYFYQLFFNRNNMTPAKYRLTYKNKI